MPITSHRAIPILLIAACSVALAWLYRFREFFHDDAYISLRYVRNLLHGQGLVWNAGERVEGYSNFFWVMLTSSLGWFGLDLVQAVTLLGHASFVLLLTLLWWYGFRQSQGSRFSTYLPLIATACYAPLAAWTWGGLETVLVALLMAGMAISLLHALDGDWRWTATAGWCAALLTLTRPEGILYGGMAIFLFLVTRRKKTLLFSVVWVVLSLPLFIWRFTYYGSLVPNTFHTKVGVNWEVIGLGLEYVGRFLITPPFVGLIALVVAAYVVLKRRWDVQLSVIAGLWLGHLGYVILVGGDHMPAFRFMAPSIPLSGIFVYLLIARLTPEHRATSIALGGAAFIVVASSLLWYFPSDDFRRAEFKDGAAFVGKVVAETMTEVFPESSLVALNTAGSTPYYAVNYRYIDMLGLCDTAIARRKNIPMVARWQHVPGHSKGDGEYILRRRPDFIIAGPAQGDLISRLWFLSEHELNILPSFRKDYVPYAIPLKASQYEGFQNYPECRDGEIVFMFYALRSKANQLFRPSPVVDSGGFSQ